jgi:hypothetical protein
MGHRRRRLSASPQPSWQSSAAPCVPADARNRQQPECGRDAATAGKADAVGYGTTRSARRPLMNGSKPTLTGGYLRSACRAPPPPSVTAAGVPPMPSETRLDGRAA